MENTMTLPATVMTKEEIVTAPKVSKKKEHLLVELVNGMTLAITMVASLSLWYTVLEFGIMARV